MIDDSKFQGLVNQLAKDPTFISEAHSELHLHSNILIRYCRNHSLVVNAYVVLSLIEIGLYINYTD